MSWKLQDSNIMLTSRCLLSESLVSAPGSADLQMCQKFWWGSPVQTQHGHKWKKGFCKRHSAGGMLQYLSAPAWLTFSDAVAIRVPCRFRAMQHSAPSWAGISTGGFSVFARSTICTWPECVPGNASRELLLLGHSTQRPEENKGNGWLWWKAGWH